jgi:hypothetical protein
MGDDDDTDRVLTDHEHRLRTLERIVQMFVDREHAFLASLSSTSKFLLLVCSVVAAVVTVLHFLGVQP